MEGIADSTTITYSKLPAYLQPYTGSTNNSVFAYGINDGHVGYTPVRYTTATISIQQLRSTHLEQNERERHLDDRGITPSPSGSSSSGSPTENNTSRDSFLPSNFETQNPVPPTPSDSAESSDRDSPNPGDRLSEGLLVRIPRKAVGPAEDRTGGTSNSLPTPASPSSSHGITVNLLDKALWQMFNSIGNEMIVTKPGR